MTGALERYRAGDDFAADDVVREHGLAVATVVGAIVGEELVDVTAADAISQALRRARRALPAGVDEREWLLRVARLHALDVRRRAERASAPRRRRERRLVDEAPERDAWTDPERVPADPTVVEQAIAAMRPALREALAYAFLYGYRPAQTAQRTGVTEAVALGRLREALLELQEAMAPAYEYPT